MRDSLTTVLPEPFFGLGDQSLFLLGHWLIGYRRVAARSIKVRGVRSQKLLHPCELLIGQPINLLVNILANISHFPSSACPLVAAPC